MAKPTRFSQALADHICDRLIRGETLNAICDEDGMPSAGTVRYWRHTNAEFKAAYEGAREAQADALFDEILEIVDDGRNDWMEKEGRNGTYIALNHEAMMRSKMRAEMRLKLVAVMNPKRFGDKAQLDLTNSDGKLASMTPEQKAVRLTAIHAAVQKRKEAAKAGKPKDDDDEGFIGDDGSDLA